MGCHWRRQKKLEGMNEHEQTCVVVGIEQMAAAGYDSELLRDL